MDKQHFLKVKHLEQKKKVFLLRDFNLLQPKTNINSVIIPRCNSSTVLF